jgi:hypothetical protein
MEAHWHNGFSGAVNFEIVPLSDKKLEVSESECGSARTAIGYSIMNYSFFFWKSLIHNICLIVVLKPDKMQDI